MRIDVKNEKEYILVDFFDTVMFREIHSRQMHDLWARYLKKNFPVLKDINIIEERNAVINEVGKWECEIKYESLIENLYSRLNINNIQYEEFYSKSIEIEIAIESMLLYPNRKIISFLKKEKELGKKIFIVSDYYLPSTAYRFFLQIFDLDDLFDDIFSSCDYECSKRKGKLYEVVTQTSHKK